MDFALTREQEMLRNMVREFAESELAPAGALQHPRMMKILMVSIPNPVSSTGQALIRNPEGWRGWIPAKAGMGNKLFSR